MPSPPGNLNNVTLAWWREHYDNVGLARELNIRYVILWSPLILVMKVLHSQLFRVYCYCMYMCVDLELISDLLVTCTGQTNIKWCFQLDLSYLCPEYFVYSINMYTYLLMYASEIHTYNMSKYIYACMYIRICVFAHFIQ